MEKILKSNTKKNFEEKNYNNKFELDLPEKASLKLSDTITNTSMRRNLTRARIIYNTKNSALSSLIWITSKNIFLILFGFNFPTIFFENFENPKNSFYNFQNLVKLINFFLLFINVTAVSSIFILNFWVKTGIFNGSLAGFQGVKIGDYYLKKDYGFDPKKEEVEKIDYQKLKIIHKMTLRTLDFGNKDRELTSIHKKNESFNSKIFIRVLNFYFNFNQFLGFPLMLIKVDFYGKVKKIKVVEENIQVEILSEESMMSMIIMINLCFVLLVTIFKKKKFSLSFPNFKNKLNVLSIEFDLFIYLLEVFTFLSLKNVINPLSKNVIFEYLCIILSLLLGFLCYFRSNYIFGEIQLIENFSKLTTLFLFLFKTKIFNPIFYTLGMDFVMIENENLEQILNIQNPSEKNFFAPENLYTTRVKILLKISVILIISYITSKNYTLKYYDFSNLSYEKASKIKDTMYEKSKFALKIINLLIFILEENGANFNFPNFIHFNKKKHERSGKLVLKGMIEEHKETCVYLNCSCKNILRDRELHKMRSDKDLKILGEDLEKSLSVIRNMTQISTENLHFPRDYLFHYCYFLTDFQNRPLQARKIIEFRLLGEENFEKFFFKFYQHHQFLKKINKGRQYFNTIPPLNLLKYNLCPDSQKLAVKNIFQFMRLLDLFKLNLSVYLKIREQIYKELMLTEINLKFIMRKSIIAISIEQFIEELFNIFEELSSFHMPNFLIYECFYQIRVKFNHFMKEGLMKNLRIKLKCYFKNRHGIPSSLFKSYLESKTCVISTVYSPISSSFSTIVYTTKNTDLVIGHPSKFLINSDISKFLPHAIKEIHHQFLRTSMAFKQKSVHCTPSTAYVNNQNKELLKVTMQIIFFCDISKDSKIKIFSFISRKKLQEDDSYLIMLDKSGNIKGASKAAIEFFGFENRVISKGKLGINYLAKEFDLLVSGLNWRILIGLAHEKNENKNEKEGETDMSLPRVLPLFFEKKDIALMNTMKSFFDSLLEKANRNMYIEYRDPNRKVLKDTGGLASFSPTTKRVRHKMFRKTGKLDLAELFDEKDLEIVEGLFKMKVIEMILPTFTIIRVIELKKISKSLSQYKEIIEKMKQGNLTMADQMKYGLNGDENMIDPQKNFIISVDKSICMMKRKNTKLTKELKMLKTEKIEGENRFKHCNFCTDYHNYKNLELRNEYWGQLISASKAFQDCLFSSQKSRELVFQRVSSLRKLSLAERTFTNEFSNNNTIISTQSRTNQLLMSESRAGSIHFKVGIISHGSIEGENIINKKRRLGSKESYKNRIQILSRKLYEIYRGDFKGRRIFNNFFIVMFFSLFFFTLFCVFDQNYLTSSLESFDRGVKLELSINQLENNLIEYYQHNEILNFEIFKDKSKERITYLTNIINFSGVKLLRSIENLQVDYSRLKSFQNIAAIDLDLLEIDIKDYNLLYENLVFEKDKNPISTLYSISQKLRTAILNQDKSIQLIKFDYSEENIEKIKNSTVILKYLFESTYEKFFESISNKIFLALSDHIESLRNYFLISSTLKFIFFFLPYIFISLKINFYQKKLSKTFRVIRHIENKNLSKLNSINEECRIYCDNIDKGFSTEPPKKKIKMEIQETENFEKKKSKELERKKERKMSIFGRKDDEEKKELEASKFKKRDIQKINLKPALGISEKSKQSIHIPPHLALQSLDDRSSYHQDKKKIIEIENFGGVNKELKKEKEGDEFFSQVIKGIFKISLNRSSSVNFSSMSKNPKKSHLVKKNLKKSSKNYKGDHGRLIISQIKNNGYEDFGKKTFFLFMLLLVLLTSLPLMLFYSISSEGATVFKSLNKITRNCADLRIKIQKIFQVESDVFYDEMLILDRYFERNGISFEKFFGHKERNYDEFISQANEVENSLISDNRKNEIYVEKATSKITNYGLFGNLIGLELKGFDIKKNYFFGREKICDILGDGELIEGNFLNKYKFDENIEKIIKNEKILIENLKEKIEFINKTDNGGSLVEMCRKSFRENFDKSWDHFSSNVKVQGSLAISTFKVENNNKQKLLEFYEKIGLYKKIIDLSFFVNPIFRFEYSILQLKNFEVHYQLNNVQLINSIILFIVLLIIQIFLFKFVKNSLKKKFKTHQLFLSFFDLEVLMKKKALKLYVDFYDRDVGKLIFDNYSLG